MKILEKLVEDIFNQTKKIQYEETDWKRGNKEINWRDSPMYSRGDLKTIPSKFIDRVGTHHNYQIPDELVNKVLSLGEYNLHLQRKSYNLNNDIDNDNKVKELVERDKRSVRLYENNYEIINFIVEFHGYFKSIGQISVTQSTSCDYYSEKGFKSNFGNTSIGSAWSKERPCVLEEISSDISYRGVNKRVKGILNLLGNIPSGLIKDSLIPLVSYWYDDYKEIKTTSIEDLNKKTPKDYFIKQQIIDGVFSPSETFINDIVPILGSKINIKKYDVHTIKLTAKLYFNVSYYFNLGGIIVKAPKSVVVRFDLSNYIDNDKIKNQIKKDEDKAERKEKLRIYNDTFDLVFHGKVIKKGVDSYDLINYLENKTHNDLDKEIKESYKPIFDKYPEIDKIFICEFGTYYKYESCGSRYFDVDVDNSHIDTEILNEIYDFLGDNLVYPDEGYVEIMNGWPERGGFKYGLERSGRGLKFFTEDYDPE